MVEKLEKNGKVAVLVSSDYGGGWSSECFDNYNAEEMLFDKDLASLILEGKSNEASKLIKEKYPKIFFSDCLEVEWVDKGTHFFIHEYDGSESIRKITPDFGYIA